MMQRGNSRLENSRRFDKSHRLLKTEEVFLQAKQITANNCFGSGGSPFTK
jgi:hypothetical protein